MRYVIEIKLTENPIDQALCDLIREYNMQDKVMVASFHDESMQNFRKTCPPAYATARQDLEQDLARLKQELQVPAELPPTVYGNKPLK
jgi:hypothetical protein